jgi:hypothetical protein
MTTEERLETLERELAEPSLKLVGRLLPTRGAGLRAGPFWVWGHPPSRGTIGLY